MRLGIFVLALALLGSTSSVSAAGARALMQESERRLRVSNETARYKMEILDADRTLHVRELLWLAKHDGESRLTFVRFLEPAAVKNVSLLIEDRGEAFNNIWSYTPATKSLRRIAGSQKRNWFMGTEFTYEDFEGYRLGAYAFEQAGSLSPCLRWARCLIIDAVPARPEEASASGYVKKRYHLEATTLFPVLIEYIGRDGPVKRLEAEALQSHGSTTRASVQVMRSLDSSRSTRLVLRSIDLTRVLDPGLFTLKYLRYEQE